MKCASALVSLGILLSLSACSGDDDGAAPPSDASVGSLDSGSSNDGSVTMTAANDADTTMPEVDAAVSTTSDAASEASTSGACGAASTNFQMSGDTAAPVLDAKTSNLQLVAGTNAPCTGNGVVGVRYQLSVAYADASGDGPTFSDITDHPEHIQLGSSPDIGISTRYDKVHGITTEGNPTKGTVLLQLCLDKTYTAGGIVIAASLSDQAGHKSAPICITEDSGG